VNTAGFEHGDRVLLPGSALESIMRQFTETLPSPLTFELTSSRAKCYVGVQEFTSPEDVITLPLSVAEALGLSSDSALSSDVKISVRYTKLPKAKKMTIKPLTSDFLDIPNHKSFLENGLRKYFTTVFPNQLVTLRHERQNYAFLITELEPSTAPACVILNTDCDLTVDTPMDFNPATGASSGARRAMQYLKVGEAIEGTAAPDSYAYYSFGYPTGIDPATMDVQITLLSEEGDADAYIALHPIRKPTLLNHEWALNGIGSGSMLLTHETRSVSPSGESADGPVAAVDAMDLTSGAEGSTIADLVAKMKPAAPPKSFYVGITAFQAPAKYKLSFDVVPKGTALPDASLGIHVPSASTGLPHSVPSAPLADGAMDGRKQCANCESWVLASNYALHVAQCARNNVKCPHPGCGKVLRKAADTFEKHWHCETCYQVMPKIVGPKHHVLYHEPHTCTCGVSLPAPELRQHLQVECPDRLISCRFCGDSVRAGNPTGQDAEAGLTEHEGYCGSRMTSCALCGTSLALKHYDFHFESEHPGQEIIPPEAGSVSQSAGTATTDSRAASPPPDVEWTCPSCTLQNSGTARSCGACDTARPRAPPMARALSSQVSQATSYTDNSMDADSSVASNGGVSWNCPVCTFSNPADARTCNICDTRKPPSHPASLARAVSHQVQPLCRNFTCARLASKSGASGEYGLCSRCWSVHISRVEAEDREELNRHLLQTYQMQMRDGCGNAVCNNPYCKNGSEHLASLHAGKSTAPAHPPLARLTSADDYLKLHQLLYPADGLASFYLCVDSDQRPVPVLARDTSRTSAADAAAFGPSHAAAGGPAHSTSSGTGTYGSISSSDFLPAGEAARVRTSSTASRDSKTKPVASRVAKAFFP
jgi:hypothetical protein